MTPAVRCRPCTPAQRAGCPLYSHTGEAGFRRRSGFRQFHRLRIRTFAPIGREWIRNTPVWIAGQNTGCRPGVFSVNAPISGDFFSCHHHLKAMLLCVLPCGGFPFLAVRRHQPDGQPGLVQHIGHAALRCAAFQPAQQRILPAEICKPALQAGVECVDAGKVLRLVPVDNGFLLILRQLLHTNPPHNQYKISAHAGCA
ncbi:hypothetical protein BACPEC_00666 [[Bacteroides] pectinophilus ATCC 43243]|uniref:Uncharacterized protein n=1 Tax=[Bacteroides] pectinophilus ATCC 43243 TaxID=483218 RepID=B7APR0_9FIRM|nr:hypothetical protein BACPEC_00666 [[Bacteroides] pectinophilus ATCC 43243]